MTEKLKVLVVDDEEVIRNLLIDVLTDAGYQVRAISMVRKALEELSVDDYNIVITDLRMPEMNGIEVIKEAKQIKENICVIAITAYPSVKSVVEAMREGAYDYIIKPFDVEEIKSVTQRAADWCHSLKEKAKQKEFQIEIGVFDGLTGLYNHRYFHEVLPREIERAKRYTQPFSLLMIDIDDFKKYNNANGHLAGDQLLTNIVKLLISSTRHIDIVFRYGGEEFVAFLPQVDHPGGVVAARRILNLIKKRLSVTVSIGVASFPDDGTTKDELISKVNSALRQAKYLGKDRVYISGEKK